MKEATESIVKHILTYVLLLMLEGVCLAQTSLSVSDLSVPTKIAPAYFGPNAFHVPDMMTGRTSSEWKLEVYADSFINSKYGPSEEYTANAFVRLTAPLFTDRVNLVIGDHSSNISVLETRYARTEGSTAHLPSAEQFQATYTSRQTSCS